MSDPRIRWKRDDDRAEHGCVTVTLTNSATASAELYRFHAVDRRRVRYHHERDERTKQRGGDRERVTDGGPVAGLVLRFSARTKLVHGRPAPRPRQVVPPEIAQALFAAGASEVNA